MIYLTLWWFTAEILGLIALPFTYRLFKNLPDRGYAFSKAIGILLPVYFIWLVVSAGILPNSAGTILIIIVLLALGAALLLRNDHKGLSNFFHENRKVIITVESIFLLSFILLAVTRSYTPQIYGTERPMDFAFINALLRADRFPPSDPWLSGYTLNNYYFGHLIVAVFTRITTTPPGYCFNIALCLFFALAAVGVFSLIFNLIKMRHEASVGAAIIFGILGIVIFLVLGNLEGILEVLYARGIGDSAFWQWIGIKGFTVPSSGGRWLPATPYWWWRSTRVIDTVRGGNSLDYTITEYPSFSFILGDLHAHVMSLPFTLLAIAFSLNMFLTKEKLGFDWIKRNALPLLIMLICLGALGAIHSWDLPTYTLVFLAAILIQIYITQSATDIGRFKTWLKLAISVVLALVVLYLPFYLNMKNPVMGILPWEGPTTRPLHYLLIFGLFFFIAVSFLIAFVKNEKLKWSSNNALGAILIASLPLILWGTLELAISIFNSNIGQTALSIGKMLGHLLPLLFITAFILFSIINHVAVHDIPNGSSLFILLLLFTGIWITVACELFYIGDVFNNRMNTIFRFYYQSWTMLAISSTVGIYYVRYHLKTVGLSSAFQRITGRLWQGTLIFLMAICLILPSGATYDRISSSTIKPTLDGLAYLRQSDAAEWEAINWLNINVTGAPVILEATGDEYTPYGRVSVNTGLPTVLGWAGHELVWRGPGKNLSTRNKDIDTIYQSNDVVEIKDLLARYQVTYIYFGYLEKARYGTAQSGIFNTFMDTVFQNEEVSIYQVRAVDQSS